MATFGLLRGYIKMRAGVSDHFQFIALSEAHRELWNQINANEYKLGYDPVEYTKPGTPCLCDMELLSDYAYGQWVMRYERIHIDRASGSEEVISDQSTDSGETVAVEPNPLDEPFV